MRIRASGGIGASLSTSATPGGTDPVAVGAADVGGGARCDGVWAVDERVDDPLEFGTVMVRGNQRPVELDGRGSQHHYDQQRDPDQALAASAYCPRWRTATTSSGGNSVVMCMITPQRGPKQGLSQIPRTFRSARGQGPGPNMRSAWNGRNAG